jgi:hypothetical protein
MPGVNNNLTNSHPLVPVGLFISSAICKEMLGMISRDDILKLFLFAKESHQNKNPSKFLQEVMMDLPKVIAPGLYLTSLLISLQNSEKSRRYNQSLQQSLNSINKKTTRIENNIHETNALIKAMAVK